MFRRFINLLKQDLTIAFRNYFQFVILFLAMILVITVNFLVPDKIKLTPKELFFDNSEGKQLEKMLVESGVDENRFFDTRKSLVEEVEKNDSALGIIMEGTVENAKFTIIHQGTESEEILNVLDATLDNTLKIIRGTATYQKQKVEYLRPMAEPIPFNKSMLPVFISFEVVALGFLLIAVMIFQEKEEGSVRAYRVSPSGTMEYMLSKTVSNILLSLAYGIIIVLFTMGFGVNYPLLLLVIFLVSALMTLLGLAVSVFFRSLQEFLFVGVGILAVLSLPAASYFTPSFAPQLIKVLPTYQVVFGLREVLFPTGKTDFIVSLIAILAVECAALLAISFWAVRRNLMKEGR